MNTENNIYHDSTVNGELYNSVVNDYCETQSVRQTAKNCNTSVVTAQRILITAGLWSSKSSRRVKELFDKGRSVDQIAEELCLTKDTVYTYMPYSRGMYGVEQTNNAQYSKEYRDRMAKAAEGMHLHLTDEGSVLLDNEGVNFADEDMSGGHLQEDVDAGEAGIVYALHLSLVGMFVYGADEDMELRPAEREELLRLAKAEKGITRDILVPGEMNLHALHYAIQKLFGWQNSHLHNFSLPQESFKLLTQENFGEYSDLCGVLFRFPDDDLSDAYWDDDYKTGISVKTWMRRKYSAPFRQLSIGDSWLGNQWEMEEFCGRFPEFTRDASLEDITDKIVIEQEFNYLIERLRIDEVFRKTEGHISTEKIDRWKKDVADKQGNLREEMEEWDLDWLKHSASQLRIWRHNMDYIEKMSWLHPDSYKEEVEKTFGQPYLEAVADHKMGIRYWTGACRNILCDWNISPRPCFDTLYYQYDYGDGWCVKISLQDIYRKTNDGGYVDSYNRKTTEKLRTVMTESCEKGKPVCVAADGLNLVDDCGGIDGYLGMLQTITGTDKTEAREMRTWARGLGWTGRKSKPENML